jgi:monoamine oxidase
MAPARASADVLVIGAGAAGLAACRALHAEGISVLVLEARNRIGGRIWTLRKKGVVVPIELGAEFVHGRAPGLDELLNEASLTKLDVSGHRFRPGARGLGSFDDFWERLDRIMRRLPRGSHHDQSFQDFLDRRPGGRSLASERHLAQQYVEGFHGADTRLISAAVLAESGSPGDDLQERRLGRVAPGYDRLIQWLAAPVADRIRLATTVSRVQWDAGAVSVTVADSSVTNRRSIAARAAIVTVPLGVLQLADGSKGAIRFVPSLTQKSSALETLASGAARRVVLHFEDRFWSDEQFAKQRHAGELDTMSFLHGTDRDFPTWWTAYPAAAPILVGWCGGTRARTLSALASGDVVELAVDALARQLRMTRGRLKSRLRAAWTHDWDTDPFARGAYSYQMVGGADAPSALARPLRRTLFFAGEATDATGATGTVHGAIATGRRAARQVMRALEVR